MVALLSTLARSRKPLSDFTPSPIYQELILTLAGLLDAFESQLAILSSAKAARIRRKIGIRTWRVLRELREGLPDTLQLLVTKTTANPTRLAVLTGHIIGVTLRLHDSGKQEHAKTQVTTGSVESHKVSLHRTRLHTYTEVKDAILSFYCSHILGAKAALPEHIPVSPVTYCRKFN